MDFIEYALFRGEYMQMQIILNILIFRIFRMNFAVFKLLRI